VDLPSLGPPLAMTIFLMPPDIRLDSVDAKALK
jgi:hypothetical protein